MRRSSASKLPASSYRFKEQKKVHLMGLERGREEEGEGEGEGREGSSALKEINVKHDIYVHASVSMHSKSKSKEGVFLLEVDW